MKTVGFLRWSFAVIFTILFSFFLTLLVGIFFVENTFNENNIYKQTNNSLSSNLTKNNSEILEQEIKELAKIGIPEEIIDKLADNEKLKDTISKYACEYSNYILKNSEKPVLSANEIKNIITDEINNNKYVLDNVTAKKLNNHIDTTVKKINDNALDKNQLKEMGIDIETISKGYNIVTSVKTLIITVIGLILSFGLILLCLKRITSVLKYIGISLLGVGVITITCFILEVKYMSTLITSDGLVDSLLLNMFDGSFKTLLFAGIGLILLGIILLIVSGILTRKSHNKSDNLLEDAIEEEVDKSYKNNLKDHIATAEVDIDEIGKEQEQQLVEENQEEQPIEENQENNQTIEASTFTINIPDDIIPDAGPIEPQQEEPVEEEYEEIPEEEIVEVEEESEEEEKEEIEPVEVPAEIELELPIIKEENKLPEIKEELPNIEESTTPEINEEPEEEIVKEDVNVEIPDAIELEITPIEEPKLNSQKQDENNDEIEML